MGVGLVVGLVVGFGFFVDIVVGGVCVGFVVCVGLVLPVGLVDVTLEVNKEVNKIVDVLL